MVFGAEVVTALHEGFAKGGDFTAVVPLLVGPGAKPYLAAATRATLASACDAGLAGVASLLLEAEGVRFADANAASTYTDEDFDGGYTLLSAAADRGDVQTVRALVDSGKADVNGCGSNGCLPLAAAAWRGRAACVEALLAADGIDANGRDSDGETALAVAASAGRAGCVRALLAADGIDANLIGRAGHTALVWAAENGHTACCRTLLAAPCVDANQANGRGETALAVATQNEHRACVLALLAADGVAIDASRASDQGWTALEHAVINNDTVCARAILAAAGGVDLGHRNFGWTALHFACKNASAEMATLLLVAGGCRFAPESAPQVTRRAPLALAGNTRGVRAAFLAGADYWQRTRHRGHSGAMKGVVLALMLTRQRLDAAAAVARRGGTMRGLARLPEELWLAVCGFIRSADFAP